MPFLEAVRQTDDVFLGRIPVVMIAQSDRS